MKQDLKVEKQWKLEIKFVDGTLFTIPDFKLEPEFQSLDHMLRLRKKKSGFFMVECPNGNYTFNIDNIMYLVYSFSYERVET